MCEDWARGQAFSLRRGVAALPDADAVVITLGDQPFITPAVIAAALAELGDHDAVRALYDDVPGHPVVLSRRVMDAVGELEGDAGARELLARFRGTPVGGGPPGERHRHRHPRGARAAVKLDLHFDVAAPIDAVWPALNDLESVAPCLPGATITGHDDGTHHGEFTLRVGPFATVHRGTVRIEDADEAAHVQRLSVGGSPGNDSRATIVNTLTETDGGTRVDAVAELTVAGPLAVFVGSGVIEDVSNRLLRDFATCLAGRLNTPSDCGICGDDVPPLDGRRAHRHRSHARAGRGAARARTTMSRRSRPSSAGSWRTTPLGCKPAGRMIARVPRVRSSCSTQSAAPFGWAA